MSSVLNLFLTTEDTEAILLLFQLMDLPRLHDKCSGGNNDVVNRRGLGLVKRQTSYQESGLRSDVRQSEYFEISSITVGKDEDGRTSEQ